METGRRSSDKIRKKNGSVKSKDIYDLLWDKVLPIAEDVAGIKSDIDNLNKHCVATCKSNSKRLANLDKAMLGKVGRGVFITIGSILTVIMAYIAVIQTIGKWVL